MAVIRVLAEAHVGDDDELRQRVLERADRLLYDTVVGEALESVRILGARDPEQEDGFHAERVELPRLGREPVDRALVDPGHRRHGPTNVIAGDDEERLDEVAGLERRLTNEIAQRRGTAEPTRPLHARAEPERLERVRVVRRHALSPNVSTSA